jgi:tryptophan synthase alpha subunit
MEESPETPKSVAYAVATQQAHKVKKSPKGFRTPEGVATARAKMHRPLKEYQKTAALAGFFDELEKVANLAAAARFGAGVLLGSMLWNSMGDEEKEELRERAQEVAEDMQKGAMANPQRDPHAQARKLLSQSRKVGQLGTKKPPEPNIRAVATLV